MSLPSGRVDPSLPGSSMYSSAESSQLDDDCASENSFGSDFGDHATDEEDLASTDAEVELDSPPPNYPDEEIPQSISIVPNIDLKSPEILQYTPEPAPMANLLKGPSTRMCVVSRPICNPVSIPINFRSATLYPPTINVEFPTLPAGLHVLPKFQILRFLLLAQSYLNLRPLRNTPI